MKALLRCLYQQAGFSAVACFFSPWWNTRQLWRNVWGVTLWINVQKSYPKLAQKIQLSTKGWICFAVYPRNVLPLTHVNEDLEVATNFA